MKPSILLFAYHYAPSNEIGARRPTALANELVARGHEVVVVSAFEGLAATDAGSRQDASIIRIRVPEPRKFVLNALVDFKRAVLRIAKAGRSKYPPADSNSPTKTGPELVGNNPNLLVRIATFIDTHKLWALHAARAAQVEIARKRPQLVYCTAPPNSALLAAAWVARRNKLPLVVDLRDAWVVGGVHEPRPSAISARICRRLEYWVFRRAQAIVVTAEGLVEKYRAAFPALSANFHAVRNGYDGVPLPPISDTGHKLRILFAGEIYVNRDPFGFLESLERLVNRDDVDCSRIEVTFVGRCEAYRDRSLAAWLQGKKCESVVRILPPVPMAEVIDMTRNATVMLNFAQGARTMIPAKSYDQMASGREILLLCERDSDTGRLFEGRRGLLRVDPAEPASLDIALEDLYLRHAVTGQAAVLLEPDVVEFSRKFQTRKYADLIEAQLRPIANN